MTETEPTIVQTLNRIQKELKAPKGQVNSYGNYKYRSAEDIVEAVKPFLGTAILTITDDMILLGDRYYVKAVATITEVDGKSIQVSSYAREALAKKGMDEAQITGSASSYARKYALNGLFCIDDTKDPDATNKHEDEGNSKVFTPKVVKGKVVNKPTSDQVPFESSNDNGEI